MSAAPVVAIDLNLSNSFPLAQQLDKLTSWWISCTTVRTLPASPATQSAFDHPAPRCWFAGCSTDRRWLPRLRFRLMWRCSRPARPPGARQHSRSPCHRRNVALNRGAARRHGTPDSNGPLVMLIGATDVDGQRCTPLIDQNVDFGAQFGAIGRVFARLTATQRRSTRPAIHGLPAPLNATLTAIELDQGLKDLVPDAQFLPSLEPLMQHAAGNTKPVTMHSLPLAAGPQDVPNPIQYGPIANARPARLGWRRFRRQLALHPAPQIARHLVVVHRCRFCGSMFAQGASPFS